MHPTLCGSSSQNKTSPSMKLVTPGASRARAFFIKICLAWEVYQEMPSNRGLISGNLVQSCDPGTQCHHLHHQGKDAELSPGQKTLTSESLSVNINICSSGLWCLNNANVRSLAFLNQLAFKCLSLGNNKNFWLKASCLLEVGVDLRVYFSALVLSWPHFGLEVALWSFHAQLMAR